MSDQIELISDGDGVAVLGSATAVQRFLASEKLPSQELLMSKVKSVAATGSSLAEAGSSIAVDSGRWVKLTKESAEAVQKFGLMPTDKPGVSHAMVGQPGSIKEWIQVAQGPGSIATNPAVLSGAAGIMSQLAMQQTMAEITDYLARIDEKLDDVARAQTNQVLARMDAVDLAIKEANTVRDTVGRVSDVTWSKIQNSSATILETQAFALRQLADLATKIEGKSKVDELAKIGKQAESDVRQWLTALARCFQLQDAIAVLELDRVLDESPGELDQHRLGLRAARRERLELIANSTELLLERMSEAVLTANSKVLLNPIQSPAVVSAANHVSTEVHEIRQLLEIESAESSSTARRWREAASDSWEQVREAGAGGVDAAKSLGGIARDKFGTVKDTVAETGAKGAGAARTVRSDTVGRAKSLKNKLSSRKSDKGEVDDVDASRDDED